MAVFDFERMQGMQKELQEKYKAKWPKVEPKQGRNMLLWMMAEAGEMADIMKKQGDKAIMDDLEARKHFIEEMSDVLMYFNDIMLCYNISPEELEWVYLDKHKENMERW